MKVYIDVVILVNTIYDFLILSSVSILLKKHISIKRILLGCLIGSTSILILFIKLDNIYLLLYKLITSYLMCKVTYKDKDIISEIFYFYVIAIILGGSQVMISGSYYKVNLIFMLIVSPLILYLYIKSIKNYRISITKTYQVVLVNNKKVYKLNGFMDTGNTLVDPITKLPVIIVDPKFKLKSSKKYYVPCNTINNSSIIECIKVDNIIIDNKMFDCLIGTVNQNIFGKYDVILNERIREMLEC